MRRAVELHIEELVLHGFAPHDRHAITDAVQQEIAARLATRGIGAAQDGSIDRMDAGTITLPRGTAAAGAAIGAAVHSTLGTDHAHPSGGRSR